MRERRAEEGNEGEKKGKRGGRGGMRERRHHAVVCGTTLRHARSQIG